MILTYKKYNRNNSNYQDKQKKDEEKTFLRNLYIKLLTYNNCT